VAVEILKAEETKDEWPAKAFREAYQDIAIKNIFRCFAVMEGDESEDPDKTAVIFIRFFIENGKRAKNNQKYILGLRFYGFGDMATIDVISLDMPNHRDILREHADRLERFISSDINKRKFFLNNTDILPIFTIGAHIKITEKSILQFIGHSRDFGGNLLGFDVNEVAKQAAFICGLSEKGDKKGNDFLEELLAFMVKNKMRKDFYEVFVAHFNSSKSIGQNFRSILAMKVCDTGLKKEKDIVNVLVGEILFGIGKKCLLLGTSQRNNR
jgi:hypothetical protein